MSSAVGRLLRAEGDGHPQLILAAGKIETGRHHADDRVALAVQVEGLAGYLRVGAEAALPQAVAHDDHATGSGPVLFGQERAAQLRLDAQQGKEVGRDALAVNPLRLADARQVKALVGGRRHAFKDLVLITPVYVVSHRGRVARVSASGVVLPDHHEPFGVSIRQGAQQHRVDDTEDGAVRADPQGQSDHGDGGEAGVFPERPQAVAQVAPESSQKIPPLRRPLRDRLAPDGALDPAQLLGQQITLGQFEQCRTVGFLFRRAAAQRLLVAVFEVLGQFLDDLGLTRRL